MATRSTIGMIQKDGTTIRSIYCHWDGYPDGVGKMLQNFYSDEEKINRLLSMGDISSLDQQIGSPTENNPFDNRTEGMTTFYKRDRGEDGVDALVHANVEEWLGFREGSWCEWGYLWDGTSWNTFKIRGTEAVA